MKRAWIALLMFFAALPMTAVAGPQTPSMEWYQCQIDSDCIIFKGRCNEDVLINGKFENAYKQMMAQNKPACGPVAPPVKNEMPACVENICVIIVPTY